MANNMKYIRIFSIVVTGMLILTSCGQSYEETKRLSREQRLKMAREDSAALKIAVMPTLDCLPIYIAKDHQLFDTIVDIRLKRYTAQMDCDTALMRGRVQAAVSDMVRTEYMQKRGTKLHYLTSTNAYWQLMVGRTVRIKRFQHLADKAMGMTRFSVTALLADHVVDSAKLSHDEVFRIQVNDVYVRLKMLENKELDVAWMTEPQATTARLMACQPLADSRKLGVNMGVVVCLHQVMKDSDRKWQLDRFIKGYDRACDSINKNGVRKYRDLIMKYCHVGSEVVDSLPKDIKYSHMVTPLQKDIISASQWLEKQ
jgi:NitT/TauT family transport system substrate-binding protein